MRSEQRRPHWRFVPRPNDARDHTGEPDRREIVETTALVRRQSILQVCFERCSARNAQKEAGKTEKWQERKKSNQPQTGHRDRSFRSAQEGQKVPVGLFAEERHAVLETPE